MIELTGCVHSESSAAKEAQPTQHSDNSAANAAQSKQCSKRSTAKAAQHPAGKETKILK